MLLTLLEKKKFFFQFQVEKKFIVMIEKLILFLDQINNYIIETCSQKLLLFLNKKVELEKLH